VSRGTEDPRRPDLRQSFRQGFDRHARRPSGPGPFWRSFRVLGSVGWPIVAFTAGGALLGHWVDRRWDTGVRWALVLVTLGAIAGSWIAWHSIGGTRR
jgi:ATP synthase protein I